MKVGRFRTSVSSSQNSNESPVTAVSAQYRHILFFLAFFYRSIIVFIVFSL